MARSKVPGTRRGAAGAAQVLKSAVDLQSLDRTITLAADVWREQLLQAGQFERAASAVSVSIAKAMAARQTYVSDALATLRMSGLETRLGITQAAQELARLRVEVSAPLRLIARQAELTQKVLAKGLQSAALAASREWGLRAREWDAQQRRIAGELQRDGWPIAPSWPVTLPSRLVEIRRARGKRALDRAICDMYARNRHRQLRRMVTSWMGDPAFATRGAIIRDAVADHAKGRYRVSIPTLLPLIEGIAVEVFGPGSPVTNPAKLYRSGADAERFDKLLAEGLLATLDVLYLWTPFASVKPTSRTLNRHLIMHGRIVRYASETNSLRVFLALDQLASEIRAKRKSDSKRVA